VLALWSEIVEQAPDDPVIFLSPELGGGGGWHGRGASERKQAMLAGKFVDVNGLSSEIPAPGEIEWPDGSRQAVPLVSAAEAFEDFKAPLNGDCGECVPLHVVGARLSEGPRDTTRGQVNVPVWEFVLSDEDRALSPLNQPAVRDRIFLPNPPLGCDYYCRSSSYAVGEPGSSELLVVFYGAYSDGGQPCGADYDIAVMESEIAVVPIIVTTRFTQPPPDTYCGEFGRTRELSVHLGSELGERTVLDFDSGWPLMVTRERTTSN